MITPWRRAVAIGIAAYVVSRLIVLFGAYTRAAQVVTDRQGRGNPFPRSTRPMIEAIFTQWDGKWYRMIAEHGYPSELPERITYITGDGATVAFFPVYPYVARWFDVIAPGGIVQALLGVNVVLSVAAVVLVGLLAREVYDIPTAQRAMVLFVLFPGSVVLSWSYAEAALIVCAAACLLFLQREQWALAGIAAAIGSGDAPQRRRHRRRLCRGCGDSDLQASAMAVADRRRLGTVGCDRLPRLPTGTHR